MTYGVIGLIVLAAAAALFFLLRPSAPETPAGVSPTKPSGTAKDPGKTQNK